MTVRFDHAPESSSWLIDPRASRPRRRALRVAFVATVLVCIGAIVARQTFASAGQVQYRTATASTRDVQETLAEVGTVAAVKQARVSFPVSGTVESIDVEVGEAIEAGERLASLDPEALERGVTAAKSTLAQAELTLERALNGEDPRGGGPAGVTLQAAAAATPAPASSSAPSAGSSPTTASSSVDQDIRLSQQEVLNAQRAVDAALLDAQEALASATSICDSMNSSSSDDTSSQDASADASMESTGEPGSDTATSSPSPEATASPSTSESTAASTTESSDGVGPCRDALQAVLDAQRSADLQQDALVSASESLDGLLSRKATELSQAKAADDPQPASGAATDNATYTPTSEELASYQKAIDAAEVDVAVADQSLRQATIHTPVSGTVKDIDIQEGDDVSAGDDASSILIVGDGGYEITAMVGVTDLPDVEVGQDATVTPDDGSQSLTGSLTIIGLASESSSGSTSYPVTISIDGDARELRNGSTVSVSIVTGGASGVLAVPTSAVRVDNGRAMVTVIEGGDTRRVSVEVGVVGAAWTQITSGLNDGQEVILADLTEALPGTATEAGQGGSGRANGFQGGGPRFNIQPAGR